METPLNIFFEENGFQSKALIKNLGSTFIYLVLYLLTIALLPLLAWLGRNIPMYLIFILIASSFNPIA